MIDDIIESLKSNSANIITLVIVIITLLTLFKMHDISFKNHNTTHIIKVVTLES